MASLPASDDSFESTLEICYEILLYLNSRMAKLQPGQVLEFVTRDPLADVKVEPWADTHEYLIIKMDTLPDGRWQFLIQR